MGSPADHGADPSIVAPIDAEQPEVARNGSVRRHWPAAVCGVLYLVLAFARFGLWSSLSSGRITGVRTLDQIQQIWFLAWAHYALVHGHNPLFTQLQNFPVGIDLGVNTSMLALGVVFSPVTALFGPIVTWNLLVRLALFASALSMCLVLRRWINWWPAAFVGGLLYGFSAFATFFTLGYLFLIFVPIPPLIFLALHEIVVRQRWKVERTGVLLGVLCFVQYFVSSELLASTLLLGAIGCGVAVVADRPSPRERVAYRRRAFAWAVGVGGILLVYPVAVSLFGRAHIPGVPSLPNSQGDLLGHVVPTPLTWLAPHFATSLWKEFGLLFYSAPTYQGIPFLVAIVVIVVWLRRSGIVVLAGLMAAIAFVLSLGPRLDVHGHQTGLVLPFWILAHVPIANGLVATRFSLFVDLFGAFIVAVGVDRVHARVIARREAGSSTPAVRRALAVALSLGIAFVVAIPLLPSHVQSATPAYISPVFTQGASRVIAPGSVVLVYPYPNTPVGARLGGSLDVGRMGDGLLGQATSGFTFNLIGGYGWTPGLVDGVPNPTPLNPLSVETLFNVAFYGSATPAQKDILQRSNVSGDLRLFLSRYRVDVVVVLPVGEHPEAVIKAVSAAIGPPEYLGGVAYWRNVQRALADRSP